MSDLNSDQAFDAELRLVPVPPGFVERLRGIAAWSDAELDHRLSDVPVPGNLRTMLTAIASETVLDEQLCEIAISPRFLPRVRNIPYVRRRSPLARFTLAASLLIIFTAGAWAALAGILLAVGAPETPQIDIVFIDQGPLKLRTPPEAGVKIVAGPSLTTGAGTENETDRKPAIRPMMYLLSDREDGPVGELLNEMSSEWDPWENWMRLRWGVFGYSNTRSPVLPDMETVPAPTPRGAEADLAREYDRGFLYRHGIQPPVPLKPRSGKHLVHAPLSTSQTGFEQARRKVRDGNLPAPEDVRAEDFLAAMSCPLAPGKPGEVAIRTAAGPSVFNQAPAGLLLVGATAGKPVRRALAATHLVVVLDASDSMNWDNRFEQARLAIFRVVRDLSPQDRFSLVVFNEAAALVADEASTEQAAQITAVLDGLAPSGGANIGLGLERGLTSLIETETGCEMTRRLVLITDNRRKMPAEVVGRLEAIFQQATVHNMQMDVLDLNANPGRNEQISDFAANTGGQIYRVATAEQMRWLLHEIVTGESALRARDVQLDVEFNPDAVAAYRLIGFEPPPLGGATSRNTSVDLHVGEQVYALFEVWLRPNDIDDVAVAHLKWQDAQGRHAICETAQRISRLQFAASFEGSPLAVQAAAIAAETAEVLRHGFCFDARSISCYRYFPKPARLTGVLETAKRVNPRLSERLEYRRFIDFVEAAARIPMKRPPGQIRAGWRGMFGGQWTEKRD